jgi:hypothetical protein
MPDGQVNLHMLYEKMGEVGAIAREAKHAANNTSAKVDALAIVVATQGELRTHVERIERKMEGQEGEIETLKADKHKRDGAIGLVEWISRHWPFTVLGSLIITAVLWANGKIG